MAAMKSALELAMEKIGAKKNQESQIALTEAQKQEISALRKQYEAKIAEKEIMMQTEMRKLIQQRAPREAAGMAREMQNQLQQTKKALQEELETKIAAIRTSH